MSINPEYITGSPLISWKCRPYPLKTISCFAIFPTSANSSDFLSMLGKTGLQSFFPLKPKNTFVIV